MNLELPISKVIAVLRQPTISDEESIMKSIAFAQKKQADLINETLVIKEFQHQAPGQRQPQVINNREDILWGYQSLAPRDKLKIFEEFQKEFGKYGIDLKAHYTCGNCETDNDLDIDIVVQFFRMAYST